MSARIFDGREFAKQRELALSKRIERLGLSPRIGSVVFEEDKGSLLYTKLKKQAAVRVGIEFSEEKVKLSDSLKKLQAVIENYSLRDDLDGLLIQKPSKMTWRKYKGTSEHVVSKVSGFEKFEAWWRGLVSVLDPKKDVDCLTGKNLGRVYKGNWKIMPATVKAVISILIEAGGLYNESIHRTNDEGLLEALKGVVGGKKAVVVGRSDIVGRPLAAVLEQAGAKVSLFGTDLDLNVLGEADIVVSATGREGLIKPVMVKKEVVIVDVGAPKGDVEESVREKASFVSPVPGGVGPVTVVSLLENLVSMVLV